MNSCSRAKSIHSHTITCELDYGSDNLSIVILSHGLLARSHIDLLNLDLSSRVRGNPNQSRLSASATVARELEEVIRVTDGFLPGLASVSADFHLGRPASRVLDRGREPVLRGAAVHLDPERVGEGTRHELPFDVDLA